MSTSKTKCKLKSSNDLKTYQRSLQPITKFFGAPSRSDEKPTFKLKDSPGLLGGTRGTLILQESPPDSSPNNSGVFQVTAKPTIDMSKRSSDLCLMNDHLHCPDLRPPKPEDQFSEKVLNNVCKRTNNKSSEGPPAKKKKADKEETQLQDKANTSAQLPSSKTEFLFEFSEDEDEKRVRLVNGDANSSKVYFCKHCDYSDVNIKHVSTHYQNNHPYIRYNVVYIQDPCDRSATFRCLQCPVEFSSVAELKRHCTENHPEGPDIFTMHLGDLCLVFKCFACPFTTSAVKELKDHYKERHPTHEMDNSLMFCRYSVNRCQEGPPQLNKFGKAPSPEKSQLISHDSAHTSSEEVKSAPSPQHATSKRADTSVYRCKRCNFSHKSVVVMHVHYQKSHPDEAVTIDKIKQSACVTSPTALQMTAEKSPETLSIKAKSTSQKNIISDSSKETGNKAEEIALYLANPTHTAEASKTHSAYAQTDKLKSAEDRSKVKKSPTKRKREMFPGMDGLSSDSPNELFYCQFCSFSGTKVKSVVGHHNAKHATDAPINTEEVLAYSFEMRKKKLQSETEASTRTTTSFSKNRKQVEVHEKNERKEELGAADALVAAYNPYACAEKLYYCQKCNYGNPSPQGVVNHQIKVHHNIRPSLKHVFEYTALIRDEMEKSKAKDSSFSSRLPLPLMVEGEEDMFFCHFCNYRHRNLKKVLWHYVQRHNGFVVKSEEIQRYTSVVLEETKKSQLKTTDQEVSRAFIGNKEIPKKKTKKLGKVSASPSIRALPTQRTLQCHRCQYSTQYVYILKRHMWNIHKSNRSSAEVLRACFKRGNLETGYHCDLCVFSHSKAIAVYKHCQEQHPGRRLSLEYVSTRLYVGPEQTKPQTKQPDGTDSCSSTQRSEQSENKKYSCRACSYKGSSLSSITRHYRAFHPWSVKEDGSVLYLINKKKCNANRQVEDQNEMPQSFDTYQVPLEFEKSLGSSPQAASSQQLKCPFCPAMFCTKRGYKTHCGMKHQGVAVENLEEQKEEQVQTQPRVHVFKCRHCTYVNTSYQGVLTHCQMRHPALESLADSLYVEASVDNWEDCVKKKKGSGLRLRGYVCKFCPQIYATNEKLSKHHEEDHDESVASTPPKKSKSDPEPSAVNKNKHHQIHNQGSVSKASFLNKNRHAVIRCQYCSYGCSTKFVLARHLQVRHKTSSVSKAQDCFYKCVLCSKLYFKKKRLGHHYANKHGKDAFLKYYAPFYKEIHKKPTEAVPDTPLNQHNTPEACESSTMAEENKKLVFKCPKCPYVNSSFHGTLTHCQMKHPELTARADELQTQEIFVSNMVKCTLGKGSNVRGYMCKRCPQIHVSLKKLKIHCEKDHNQAKKRPASKHSVECETEQRPETGFQGSILDAFALKIKTSATGTSEIDLSQQLDTRETLPSNSLLQDKKSFYKCHVCTYAGSCRKYLYCHYKNTHKLDAYTTYKLLEKYSKYKHKSRNMAETKSKEIAHVKCKLCPNLTFNSSQQLISHYSTLHLSDSILDFTVLNQASKRTTGLYRCSLCKKQMNGTRILCYHLDRHRDKQKNSAKTAMASDNMTTPPTKSFALGEQDELPMLETVEDLAQWNVTPVQTFTVPPSSPLFPLNPRDPEQPDLESKEDKLTCKQCGRTFMSMKGLRSHERSHATLAAIKKRSTLSTSTLKHDINKYVLYKDGNLRPFLCSICSYRTTVLSLWRSHFMKKHRDVVMDRAETDGQDEETAHMANEECPNSSDELNNLPELDNEPKNTEESLYLEPPDVQRQLNHYSLMAQASTISKKNVEEAKLPDNSLLPCEFCNFNTGHLSSVRRHYLNRHGKKMLRCKDCNFFTGIRKTLEMHIDKGHSTCQSEPTHQKDLRCPFCLYQTKNKNNMIDHVVLHREERVVPIEVRRPKLSRYLQGLVFRCHKCTFTSGSAEMLRLHMMKHDDIKPYKCRLCYFDCPQLNDLEAHLNDKHQVMRNHELVGQVSLDQLEASVCRMPEEEAEHLSDMEHHNDDSENIKTEEFDTCCNEVLNKTQAKNPAENNIGENTLMIKEAFQNKGQDGKNGNEEEHPAECSVLDLQYEDKKTITTDRDKQVQDTQEGETVFFSHEDCNFPEKYGQTNKNQPKLRAGDDTSVTFTQLKQRSTTSGNTLEEAQAHKFDFMGQKHRTMNAEDKIEDDILRHVLQLDEDGSNYNCKMHKKSDWIKTVKMEQTIEPQVTNNVLNGHLLYDEEGSIAVANSQQIQVQTNAISTSAKTNHSEANQVRAQEPLTFERNLLTLGPNFGQLKIIHKGILGVSFRKGKEKQKQTQNNSTEVRDTYGEMPVLEKERLKEEIHSFSCCKEEAQSNQSDQKEAEEEMVTEDVKTKEGNGIKKTENLHVPEGAVSNGETTQEKLFTCDFCGRILMNSSELEHHTIRHGI